MQKSGPFQAGQCIINKEMGKISLGETSFNSISTSAELPSSIFHPAYLGFYIVSLLLSALFTVLSLKMSPYPRLGTRTEYYPKVS